MLVVGVQSLFFASMAPLTPARTPSSPRQRSARCPLGGRCDSRCSLKAATWLRR